MIENHSSNEIVDLGNNHQWLINPLGEKLRTMLDSADRT